MDATCVADVEEDGFAIRKVVGRRGELDVFVGELYVKRDRHVVTFLVLVMLANVLRV